MSKNSLIIVAKNVLIFKFP